MEYVREGFLLDNKSIKKLMPIIEIKQLTIGIIPANCNK